MKVVMISRWDGVRPGAATSMPEYAATAAVFWQRMSDTGTVESRQECAPMQHQGGLNVTVLPDVQHFNDLLTDREWMELCTAAGGCLHAQLNGAHAVPSRDPRGSSYAADGAFLAVSPCALGPVPFGKNSGGL